ncbi:MAG: hypothetical protein WCY93_07815 [Anaerolineaceae bacterium]
MTNGVFAHKKFPVDVYRNLSQDTWSILNRRTRKVDLHSNFIIFPGPVKFVVQPAGREKVRQTGQKNVHAFVRGEEYFSTTGDYQRLQFWNIQSSSDWVRVDYNPYDYSYFFWKGKYLDNPVYEAPMCVMEHDGSTAFVWIPYPANY